MGSHRLIGGNTQLQQFADFQQALTNAASIFCRRQAEDVKHLVTELEEVVTMDPKRPEDDVIIAPGGTQKFAKYHKDKKTWTRKVENYTSNKSTMCSMLLGQCDFAMHAMLEMIEDWESNTSNLLFVLKAAHWCSGEL